MRSRFINDNDGSALKKSFVLLPYIVRISTSNMKYFDHRIFTEDTAKSLCVFGKMVARETILHYCVLDKIC